MRLVSPTTAFFLLSGLGIASAQAQATATASQGIRLSTYALGSYVRPQFNTIGNSVGGTVGADIEMFHFHRFDPSLDARATASFGTINQLFVGGGPRVSLNLGRIRPYADFLVGYGTMSFTSSSPSYTHDNSGVVAFGGGVDFSLNRSWAIRADVQRQRWQLAPSAQPFYPVTASFGIQYRFHFKNKSGPE